MHQVFYLFVKLSYQSACHCFASVIVPQSLYDQLKKEVTDRSMEVKETLKKFHGRVFHAVSSTQGYMLRYRWVFINILCNIVTVQLSKCKNFSKLARKNFQLSDKNLVFSNDVYVYIWIFFSSNGLSFFNSVNWRVFCSKVLQAFFYHLQYRIGR